MYNWSAAKEERLGKQTQTNNLDKKNSLPELLLLRRRGKRDNKREEEGKRGE